MPNSPLLDDKPDLRWVVQPLEVLDSEEVFFYPEVFEPLAEHTADRSSPYVDENWLGECCYLEILSCNV